MRRSLTTLLHNSLSDLLILSLEPTLANKLIADFNLSPAKTGLFFALFFGGRTLGTLIAIFFPEEFDHRKIIVLASVGMSVFIFFVGPSHFFHLSNKV